MIYLDELFVSIQGESRDSGFPCIFVRLHGCPFRCEWCDQPQDEKAVNRISIQRLLGECILIKRKTRVDMVCITGGEPLIQSDELYPLVYELQDNGFRVSIETSGLVPIESVMYDRSYRYIMDIKCPSSGMSGKNKYDNLLHLKEKDDVVFVIKDREDFNFMVKILHTYPIRAQVYASPVFDNDAPQIGKELVDWILEAGLHKVKVQVQIHKCLGVM